MHPSGLPESRTATLAEIEAASTQFPLFMLRRDLRQTAPRTSGPISDDIPITLPKTQHGNVILA